MPLGFSVSLSSLLLLIFAFCLFSVKLTIAGFGEGGARLDDVLILVALGLLLYFGRARVSFVGQPWLRAYCIFLLFSLVATLYSALLGRVELLYSIAFTVRLMQYLIFYFVGCCLRSRGAAVRRLFVSYLAYLVVLIPLQLIGVIPAFNGFGGARASGNANGPYELAAIASFLIFYFAAAERRFTRLLLLVAAVGILLLTASRITIVGVTLAVLLFHGRQLLAVAGSKVKGIRLLAVLAFIVALAMHQLGGRSEGADLSNGSVLDRFTSLQLLDQVQIAADFLRDTPAYSSATAYAEGAYIESLEMAGQLEGDASGNIRFLRWAALLKSTFQGVDSVLLGMGPSFGSIAVDGYILRVFVECGLVGLGLYAWFVLGIYKDECIPKWVRAHFAAMLITAAFIDIFASYKAMMLLWFSLGMFREPVRSTS